MSAIILPLTGGCALLPHKKAPPTQEASAFPATERAPSPVPNSRSFLPHFSFPLPFFRHEKRVPHAEAKGLERVGIIRTVAADGSYVIIEMEPGVVVPPGRDLLVTGSGGSIIHLKSAETEPPYFIADVVSGQPSSGQIVQQ